MPVENQGHTELSVQMLKQLPNQCNNFFEFKDLCLHVRPLHDVSLAMYENIHSGRVWTAQLVL